MNYFFKRCFVFLFDYFIISAISFPVGALLSVSTPSLRAGGYLLFGGPIILGTTLTICYFYHVSFWSAKGQTPGKMITQLRVIDKRGKNPGAITSSKRYLGYLIGVFTLGIAFLYILTQKEGKGIHDHIANTKVIQKKK